MSKNINSKIRQRLTAHKHKHRTQPPNNQEGHDGDLLFATDNGVNKLYGKINNEWYAFGNGQKIGYRGRSDLNQGAGDQLVSNIDIKKQIKLHKIPVVSTDTDKFLMAENGIIKSVTGDNLRSYIGAGTGDGDITGVSITTDSGAGSKAEDTGDSADFSILGSSGVGVTNSGTTITAVAVPAEIDHDSLNNFVANEHVDHTSVTLTAGDGLTGGGDISSNRSFAVNVDDSTIEINSDSLRIKDDGVTYAKLQNVTNARMLGNNAGSDGVVTEMTKANVLSFLNVADGAEANVSGDSGNAAIYDNSGTPAFKSGITKAEVLALLNVADGATANAGDVTLAGAQTITGIKTFNADVKIDGNNSRFLYLDGDGESAYVAASSGTNLVIGTDGTDQITITDEKIEFGQNKFLIKERTSAGSDEASFGQIWVKNDSPNNLYFTDDTGQDVQITNDGSLAASGGASALNDLSDVTYSSGDLTISSLDKIVATNSLEIEASGGSSDISFDSGRGRFFFMEDSTTNAFVRTGSFNLIEQSNAHSDSTGYGQIWVKDDTPNNLYFTDDAGTDIPITNNGKIATAQNPHIFEYGGRARVQYNNWYYGASTTYGHNYFYYFNSTGTSATPSIWVDSLAPSFLVPRDGTVTGYTIIGNINTTDTFEWMCMKGAQPTFGSAGNWTLSQIGATQSAGGTSNILYKWEQTGLSVSVTKNDMLAFFVRRTTDNDASYAYCEFSAYITME